jgi:putative glycosyltransferase (TIGR04348 family)
MGITQNIKRGHVVIISPALSDANNGNWQTANRWRQMLAPNFHCRIVKSWPDKFANQDDVMIALHAKKSAHSIAAWIAKREQLKKPNNLIVALTGTDLYRDIQTDAAAQASLVMASRLIVLQELAPLGLPEGCRKKTEVIFQSTTSQSRVEKPTAHLRALMVGHLRSEKSPETLFAAARLLNNQDFDKLSPNGTASIFIDHIGGGLDADLAKAAEMTAKACPRYRWLDVLPHEATRRAIGRAHVLVHASVMEGGAHVLMEAVCSGTPVLASRIDGNVGMLGADYAGYFDWGDAAGLAQLLRKCRASQGDPSGFLAKLQMQCAARAPLFAPEAESAKLNALVAAVLESMDASI